MLTQIALFLMSIAGAVAACRQVIVRGRAVGIWA
jgi:hypothetical protein